MRIKTYKKNYEQRKDQSKEMAGAWRGSFMSVAAHQKPLGGEV